MAQIVSFKDPAYGEVVGGLAGANPAIFDWVVAYSGIYACANATATTTIPLPGVLATDIIIITPTTVNSVPRYVKTAIPTADAGAVPGYITVVFSGNTATGDFIYYTVFRQLA